MYLFILKILIYSKFCFKLVKTVYRAVQCSELRLYIKRVRDRCECYF